MKQIERNGIIYSNILSLYPNAERADWFSRMTKVRGRKYTGPEPHFIVADDDNGELAYWVTNEAVAMMKAADEAAAKRRKRRDTGQPVHDGSGNTAEQRPDNMRRSMSRKPRTDRPNRWYQR